MIFDFYGMSAFGKQLAKNMTVAVILRLLWALAFGVLAVALWLKATSQVEPEKVLLWLLPGVVIGLLSLLSFCLACAAGGRGARSKA